MRYPSLLIAAFLVTGAQAQLTWQAKYLHNDQKTVTSFRATSTQQDTLYYMPPPGFHRGYGEAQGWVVGLHDADASTSESVKLGFQSFDAQMTGPDPSKNLGVEITYSLFGTSTGAQTRIWLLTVGNSSPVQPPIKLPPYYGLRVSLPAPVPGIGQTWQQVAVSLLQQQGSKIQYPSGVAKRQMTFVKTGATTAQPIGEKGSTFFFGALLSEPTLQIYLHSTAYGITVEDLFGPESLYPDSARGDQIGWFMSYRKYGFRPGSQLVVPLVAPNTLRANVSTAFGDLILGLNFLALAPMPLDATGSADSGPVPIPKGISLWTQALFIDANKGEMRLSCAQQVRSQ